MNNMAANASRSELADMNVNVIYTFDIGHYACNGLRSVETDIYLGCVWFTAI